MKSVNFATVIFVLAGLLLISGCETFHLTRQDFLQQFANSQKAKIDKVMLTPPYIFFNGSVNGYDLVDIVCYDKDGQKEIVDVKPSTTIKITKYNGTKATFYLTTMHMQDSALTGSRTRGGEINGVVLPIITNIKPIKLKDISKIEISE